MALHGLSRGDRQEFSLECLCLSDNSGEAGNRRKERTISVAGGSWGGWPVLWAALVYPTAGTDLWHSMVQNWSH